jgi:hypothetical protein
MAVGLPDWQALESEYRERWREDRMDEKSGDEPIKHISIHDLKVEAEAEELLDSAAMEPYVNLAMAVMGGKDAGPAIEAITGLPLDKRYVWRVASALKWAFTDFDTLNVEADRQTLSAEDRRRLVELLEHRPLQFAFF